MAKQSSNEAIVDEEPSNAAINPAPIGMAGSSGDMSGMAANEDDFTLAELLTMQDAINYSLALSGDHQLSAKLGRHIKGKGKGNDSMAGSSDDMSGISSASIAYDFIKEEIDEVYNGAARLIQAWWCVKRPFQA